MTLCGVREQFLVISFVSDPNRVVFNGFNPSWVDFKFAKKKGKYSGIEKKAEEEQTW